MDTILNPRAARYAKSHGVPVSAPAAEPAIDWAVLNHDRNSQNYPKFRDHAFGVLRGEPTITDSQREDLWSLFHDSKDSTELAGHLSQLPPLHPDFVKKLLLAKNKPSVELDAADKLVQAIQRMAALPSNVLETAESHPHVLGHYMANQAEESK